ncbi:MAG TPA: ferritin family protein [Usitatibacteraceae bacterium]|nr:ferritin family protein [Usitatibacteraceae bacterium]
MLEPIGSIEEFLAHALAIEQEAARSYREFQAHFNDHGEEVLAGLCGNIAHFEQEHYELLLERTKGRTLPALTPERYRWLESGPPESAAHELVYRVATPRQLLEIALKAERNARRFFEWVAGTTADGEVHALATEMAREESEHVQWVTQALEYARADAVEWDKLLAAGGGPGLALGGERRVRRNTRA